MNFFQKIKMLFSAQSAGKAILQGATEMQGSKPGWKTTEFWFGLVLPKVMLFATMAEHVLPPTIWAWTTTFVAIAYIAGRSGVKVFGLILAAKAGSAVAGLAEINAQTAVVNQAS